MYIKIAAGLVRSYPPKNYDYKHDLGKKYLNSIKAAAFSTNYKMCLTNSYQKILILT